MIRRLLELISEFFRTIPRDAQIIQELKELKRNEVTDVRPLLRWGKR